jgi:hypothetical protein
VSDTEYRQMVADLAAGGLSVARPKSDIREQIVHRVLVALDAGEQWAVEVVERWQREGAEADYERAHRALNTTTYIRRDGRRVRKTVSYSQPKRAVDTGSVVEYRQMSFWDYSLAELLDKHGEIVAQGGRLAEIAAALGLVIAAMRRHPGCRTARDAWLADGHDLGEIDLSAVV